MDFNALIKALHKVCHARTRVRSCEAEAPEHTEQADSEQCAMRTKRFRFDVKEHEELADGVDITALNLGAGFGNGMARFNNVDVAAKYAVSPALFVMAAYDYLKGSNVTRANGQNLGNQHYNQVSLMTDYFLSKRTDVYLEGAYQRASGTSSTGGAAVADIGNLGDSTNNHQFVVRAALRHKF
ncbi:porin [Burkholderia sp. SCN-KJ]|uniref:porin n=1 Tax=Burkholderia sp. SCN-KJ TaxID=2969248 RepID=UPI0021500BDA|nr:porin [Burkholderia sp. SCN-KJ]MCR4467844.1 porin [Burkholderia sp. SCN-KJ]